MRIPIIRADEPLSQIPVTATTQGAGRAWDAIGNLGATIAGISADIAERQTNIRIATNTAQAENDFEAFNMDTVNELRKKGNPETYYQEWANKIIPKAKELVAQAKGPRERAAIELRLNQIGQRELVEQKYYANKLSIETEMASRDQSLINYANQGKLKEGLDLIEATKDLDGPKKNLKVKEDYKAFFEKRQEEIDKAKGIEAIRIDPRQAYMDLHDPNYLPHLTGTDREQYKNNALSASKILEGEQEKKAKEAEKLAHDKEDRQIGDLFLAGNYKDAYVLTQGSKFLTGDEKRIWGNAIDTKTKEKAEVVDPSVEAAEIVRINNLITKEINPNVIRDSIIVSPRLSKGNKEQYLLKLETKLSQEIKDGRNLGYKDIQDIIIPKRGMLANLLETPAETIAVKKAQMALDDWIDTQTKSGKTPTMMEVRRKAQDLANHYQIGIAEKIGEMEREARETAEQIKKAKQKK